MDPSTCHRGEAMKSKPSNPHTNFSDAATPATSTSLASSTPLCDLTCPTCGVHPFHPTPHKHTRSSLRDPAYSLLSSTAASQPPLRGSSSTSSNPWAPHPRQPCAGLSLCSSMSCATAATCARSPISPTGSPLPLLHHQLLPSLPSEEVMRHSSKRTEVLRRWLRPSSGTTSMALLPRD